MNKKKNVHVVPHGEEWATKTDGDQRAGKVTPTQKEAIEAGRDKAKRDGVELVIHDKHGRIRAKDSFGNDPFPPRG